MIVLPVLVLHYQVLPAVPAAQAAELQAALDLPAEWCCIR